MIKHLRTFLLILILVSIAGCAALSSTYGNRNEVLTGTLDLEIQAVLSSSLSPGSINLHYLVDLEARAWWNLNSTAAEKHSCNYQLKGRRLHIEIDMDIKYNPDRVPPTLTTRRVITIDGKFAERNGDFLRGPFKGTAVQQYIRRSFNDYRGEWTYSSNETWSGTVTGQCTVNGEVVDGIWAIPPSY